MTDEERELIEQIDTFLAMPNQSWLFGAGISYDAGIPLMNVLTERVLELAAGSPAEKIISLLKANLPKSCHIEHLLSQLGDYCALAERSEGKKIQIGDRAFGLKELEEAHNGILNHISYTVRWGCRKKDADDGKIEWTVGSHTNPLVNVNDHRKFAHAVFSRGQAGLQKRRGPVRIFTTNYDTLIEDALALAAISCWDGFSGGALAFRSHRFGDPEPSASYRAHLIKLHGSIDWYLTDEGNVYRVRDGDRYPDRAGRVLIYPQATKYVATQRDPFAAQFELFRRALGSQSDNVLCACGYSFGDDHINQELELGLSRHDSKTTLIAFLFEGRFGLPACVERWRQSDWGQRIYILTEKGIYAGTQHVACEAAQGKSHEWWKFSEVTKALTNGLGSLIQ